MLCMYVVIKYAYYDACKSIILFKTLVEMAIYFMRIKDVVRKIFFEIDYKYHVLGDWISMTHQSINQGLFSIQTNNDNNIHTFINMNTEREGNEVILLI